MRAGAVQFEALETLQAGIAFATVIAIGPEDPDPTKQSDGCVYVGSGDSGQVRRICFAEGAGGAKTVTSNTLVVDLAAEIGQSSVQFMLGMEFDPASDPSGEIHLYMGYALAAGATVGQAFDGRIARAVSSNGGTSYTTDASFITGLSKGDFHYASGLAFGRDGCLYISKGNNSQAGYDADYAESRLSSAILRACFKDASGAVDPGFDRDCGDDGVQETCDVEVYASGMRNAYDLLWHSNGLLYSSDNDADPSDSQSCPNVANTFGCACQTVPSTGGNEIGDELNLVEKGRYYGSPNPYLANPSGLQCQGGADVGDACSVNADCSGGTCEELSALCVDELCDEDVQCLYLSSRVPPGPGDDPNGLYRAPILEEFGTRFDGMSEFRPPFPAPYRGSFCSDWDRQLLLGGAPGDPTSFNVKRVSLTADGFGATYHGDAGLQSLQALDLAVGQDGSIFAARWNGGRVDVVRPIVQADPLLADFFAPCDVGAQAGAWNSPSAPAALPSPTPDAAAATLAIAGASYVYVFGDGSDEVLRYDVTNDLWASSDDAGIPGAPPSPPFPSAPGAGQTDRTAVTLAGDIQLIGGVDALGALSAQMWRRDGVGDPSLQRRSDIGCKDANPSCANALAVRGVAAAAAGDWIYIAGGLCDPAEPGCTCNGAPGGCLGGNSDRALRHHGPTNDWFEIAALPIAVHAASGASWKGRFYVFGGRQCGDPSACEGRSDVQIYDPASDSWSSGAPMPEGCSAMGNAAVLDDRIYVVGGEGGTCSGGAVQEYTPASDSWRLVASLPTARAATSPVVVGDPRDGVANAIFVPGGSASAATMDRFAFGCEECRTPLVVGGDADDDRIYDAEDNCPFDANEGQQNNEGDALGDVCDDDDDDDGLLDAVETDTGAFAGPNDTGSDPLVADTDGDGWSDGEEVAAGSDPNDAQSQPALSLPAVGPAGRALLAMLLAGFGLRVWLRKLDVRER